MLQFFRNGQFVAASSDNPLPTSDAALAEPTYGSGIATAPAAGAVVADTGNLAAGSYRVEISLAIAGASAAGKDMRVEHRNAADGANIRTLGGVAAGGSVSLTLPRVTIAEGESLRAVAGAVAGAVSETYHALIVAYPLG